MDIQETYEQNPQFSPNIVPLPPKKSSKKTALIIGGAILAVVAIVVILLIPSRFERVKKEALEIAGQLSSTSDTSFTIDTYPYENSKMSSSTILMLAPETQEKALEAIKYVNEELGFDDYVYQDMLKTTAAMGRQTEENNKYKVTWTYHPNKGLEVTYREK